jgi:hypothetical protein
MKTFNHVLAVKHPFLTAKISDISKSFFFRWTEGQKIDFIWEKLFLVVFVTTKTTSWPNFEEAICQTFFYSPTGLLVCVKKQSTLFSHILPFAAACT